MNKSLFLPALFAALLGSCNPSHSGKPSPATEQEAGLPNPDNSDLLDVLQGRWQSETDSTYVIVFSDNKMQHFNNGGLTLAGVITIDGNCSGNICDPAFPEGTLPSGWCFVEKADDESFCHIVVVCDSTNLQFRTFGAAGGILSFIKI